MEKTLFGEKVETPVDELMVWVVSRGFRDFHYCSGVLPVVPWQPLRLVRFDYGDRDVLTAHFDVSGLPLGLFGQATIAARVMDGAGNVVLEGEAAVDARALAVKMPLGDLEPGEYTLVGVLTDAGGTQLGEAPTAMVVPDAAAWLGNTIGLTETVPEPFTPIQVDGQSVHCWGREYRFAASGLPEQIVSRGEELLAGPVTLTTAQTVEWSGVELAGEGRETEVRARGLSDACEMQCASTVEYDGMIRVDLTITPRAAGEIEGLTLTIPVRPERATYLVRTDCAGTGSPADERYGALPAEGWRAEFHPFVWLGDEDRGLVWFCEAPEGWVLPEDGKPIEVARRDGAVDLTITIAAGTLKLDGAQTFTFGLQAGPVRPRPDDWHQFTARHAPIPTSYDYFGIVPTCLRERPDDIARQRERGQKLLVYTFLGEAATCQPEYRYFAGDWRRAGTLGTTSYMHDKVCPASSFADFKLWNFKQALDEFDLDGLYYDLAWPEKCSNPRHGCAWIDANGDAQPRHPIFAYRELAKRTYQLFHERMPRSYFIGHISGNAICLPVVSFVDFALDGEQYAHTVEKDYISVIPLDKMRAEFTSRQFGAVPLFLPELYRRGNHIAEGPTETAMVLTFLHDILVYPAFHNGTVRGKYDAVWEAFGVDGEGVEFLPYWSNTDIIGRDAEDVEVSAYRRQGSALLVIGNLSAEAVNVTLTIDWPALGLAGGVALTDGVSGETMTADGNTLTVPVDGQRLRMIVARTP